MSQHRSGLHPDDLLMHEGAELGPDSFHHRLPFAGVPKVPGRSGDDGEPKGEVDEPAVQVNRCLFIVIYIGAAASYSLMRTVLIALLSFGSAPAVGMRTTSVIHGIRR